MFIQWFKELISFKVRNLIFCLIQITATVLVESINKLCFNIRFTIQFLKKYVCIKLYEGTCIAPGSNELEVAHYKIRYVDI